MKYFHLVVLGVASIFCCQGCFAPLHTSYDSARSLPKNQVQVLGAGSSTVSHFVFLPTNHSLGSGLAYGLSDAIDLRFRYERFWSLELQELFLSSQLAEYTYVEVGAKVSVVPDLVAISVPVGRYVPSGQGSEVTSIHPQVITSAQFGQNVELTAIPNVHILLGDNKPIFFPGIITGLSISTDINQWAIRPELGVGLYLTVGVGAYVNL